LASDHSKTRPICPVFEWLKNLTIQQPDKNWIQNPTTVWYSVVHCSSCQHSLLTPSLLFLSFQLHCRIEILEPNRCYCNYRCLLCCFSV
jgi:hypothetical protein